MARQMKDSGIEWIGEIPETWQLLRMKSCIEQRDSGSWGDEATGEEGDTICLRIADFDYARFRFKDTALEDLTMRHYDMDVVHRLLLQENDILIEKSGGGEKTPVGRTVLFDKSYPALYANFMDRLRCASFVYPPFMQYLFITFYKNDYTRNYIKQTTGIQNLDLTSMLANEKVAMPLFHEQHCIAAFLDRKCAEIDAVIERTKATIEEYKKLKQAVITEAVTKGVRGPRPMKDSGIEWIGEIPEGWSVPKFGYVAEVKSNLVAPELYPNHVQISPENIEKGSGRLLSYGTVADAGVISGNHLFREGQILYSKIRPKLNKVCIAPCEGLCSADMYPIETHHVTRLVMYCMLSDVFLNQVAMVTEERVKMPKINQEELARIRVAMPGTTDEESEIVEYLDMRCSALDTLIAKKTALLTELETYKKSLIYEYVTGKKEVEIWPAE